MHKNYNHNRSCLDGDSLVIHRQDAKTNIAATLCSTIVTSKGKIDLGKNQTIIARAYAHIKFDDLAFSIVFYTWQKTFVLIRILRNLLA
ncbi:hypothetical protein [Campylobacter hyointestinalis]|uniref:hypothetical protein n=1 Tax=Campylobacter hyointestinalis TaxID=198 RepID=UPI0012661E69|nr:hypothetical protein [Campylobacter hyointestinalis]